VLSGNSEFAFPKNITRTIIDFGKDNCIGTECGEMQFGSSLLVCLIILSLADVLNGPLKYYSINKWVLAAVCAGLIAVNLFPVKIFTEFIFNPAALIVIILLASLTAFSGFLVMAACVVCAGLSAVIISFIDRSSIDFIKGIWIFIVVFLPLISFSRMPFNAMLCGALIPLFTDIADAANELISCGYTIVQLGRNVSFDAIISIVLFSAGLSYVVHRMDAKQQKTE
jgi:hypothetical protein